MFVLIGAEYHFFKEVEATGHACPAAHGIITIQLQSIGISVCNIERYTVDDAITAIRGHALNLIGSFAIVYR
ncbi:hypothetical protein D3C87_1370590 [compost metagenome]